MVQEHTMETVSGSIEVKLSRAYIAGLREASADGLSDYTDERIVLILAEDILYRYFNEEYFDLGALDVDR